MQPSPTDPAADAEDEGQRLRKAQILAGQAETWLEAGRAELAVPPARQATELAPTSHEVWEVLGRALEAQGDFPSANAAYGEAAALSTEPSERWGIMGRTALRLGDYAMAERMLVTHLRQGPATTETIIGLAQAQTRMCAFDRARETLNAGLETDPAHALLWLTLGQLLAVEGRHGEAANAFEEALRLDPVSASARAGLADALWLSGGDAERVALMGEEALATAAKADLPAVIAAHARRLLGSGRLEEGWAAFARGSEPGDAAVVEIRMAAPRWAPGAPLEGRLVLVGEQDLGDELLLAQIITRVMADGFAPILAVDSCWQTLAQRSFPGAMVVPRQSRTQGHRRLLTADLDSPYVHERELVAAVAPLRSLAQVYRSNLGDFADAGPYLQADGQRIDHWRRRLADFGPELKIGLLWRTPTRDGSSAWGTPLLSVLDGALSVPGVRWIGLERDEVTRERDLAAASFGPQIHAPPPDLDRGDLDDFAALACALDVVVGPPDAMTFLAAACGAETWFLSPPRHWALLGAEAYPWFPNARVISAAASDDWSDAMVELGRVLAERVAEG